MTALYPRLLGASWQRVAEPVRYAHASAAVVRARGRLRIAHGGNRLTTVLATVLRLPPATEAADTQLVVTPRDAGERWVRTFDGRRLHSWQYCVGDGVLGERFGMLDIRFRIEVLDGGLVFRQIEAAIALGFIRLRLPANLAPAVHAREEPAGPRRTRVHVSVALPAVGPFLTYDGIIDFEEAGA